MLSNPPETFERVAELEFHGYLEESIARLNASGSRTTLTRDEFLTMTEADSE